ncbi:MAG: hypothetical protein IJZ79_02690 [Bacilli bacterium]|nr:hypothetical protein [Bacilli bacterium]MBQ8218632.1 hypothetical protein [Bacilli bacterium]
MKNTEFKINTTKRNIIIAVVVIMVAAMAGIFVGCKAHNANANTDANVVTENITSEMVEESTTPAPTEEPTSTPEATVEPTTTPEASEEPTSEPTSTPEATEEPESTPEPTEAPETPAPTEEPTKPEPTEPPHTHNYSASVTQPTCTTQGYTTYTCNCGHSYKDNYTNGSHNYSNGTCTACGASDPNYIPPHTHSWTEHTWTEDVVPGETIQVYVCDCNIEWSSMADLNAHQASEPLCTGWSNKGKWIETIIQIIHHYRECACGAREDID